MFIGISQVCGFADDGNFQIAPQPGLADAGVQHGGERVGGGDGALAQLLKDGVAAEGDVDLGIAAFVDGEEAARAFAIDELALRDGKSYRKYADMGRPYVVHNVVATPEFAVEPHRWCFPITGCITYRGYFNEASARSYGRKLSLRGNDVSVDGVPTYSTLGRLPDPVFGSMLGWRDTRLIGTMFHELAHERLYFAEVERSKRTTVDDQRTDALAVSLNYHAWAARRSA